MARKKVYVWQAELDLAKSILADEPGEFVVATDAYVAFRYIEPGVRLVFYPHRFSSSRVQHLRIRFEPCKDKARAEQLQKRLDLASPFGTFRRNNQWNTPQEPSTRLPSPSDREG